MIIVIACILGIVISSMLVGHELVKVGGDIFVFFMNSIMVLMFILIVFKTINF